MFAEHSAYPMLVIAAAAALRFAGVPPALVHHGALRVLSASCDGDDARAAAALAPVDPLLGEQADAGRCHTCRYILMRRKPRGWSQGRHGSCPTAGFD